jgi:hypothetical protein
MVQIPEAQPIVQALGGPAKVSRALKSEHSRGHVSLAAVCQWKNIPVRHCQKLVTLPKIDGTFYALHELRPDVYPKPPRFKAA